MPGVNHIPAGPFKTKNTENLKLKLQGLLDFEVDDPEILYYQLNQADLINDLGMNPILRFDPDNQPSSNFLFFIG